MWFGMFWSVLADVPQLIRGGGGGEREREGGGQ